ERVDIVAAPGEQADHPRQHAGLVVDQHRQGVGLDLLRDGRGGGMGGVHGRIPMRKADPSFPGLTRQSILFAKKMDARVKPAHDSEVLCHTITLPSSVMASSTLTVASPSSISLWARPEGIIGKQFSLGSTTQSKITGLFTLIISRIAPSTSPGRSQRMPTA